VIYDSTNDAAHGQQQATVIQYPKCSKNMNTVALHYCIYTLVALSGIRFELMPHNDNYLRNILRQRLQYYRPAGRCLARGLAPTPEKI